MLYLDKTKNEVIHELTGWSSLQSYKDSLDRSGELSARQTYIDSLSNADIGTITEEKGLKLFSVPQRLTPAQARLALLHIGKLSQIEALMADPTTPTDQKILWEYATFFDRKNPILVALADALNLAPSQVDELFVLGSAMTA